MPQAGEQTRLRLRTKEAGFTLIEMLAVIAILGITLSTASILMRPSTDGVELRAAAVHIASTLRSTRNQAILQQSEKSVLVDVDRKLIWSEPNRRAIRLGQRLRIAITSAQSQRRGQNISGIRFYPNGSSSGATIRLSRKGETHEVRVNWLTGRISQKSLTAR